MSDLIHVQLVGRLTRDAELRQAGDQQVCGFRMGATPYKKEAMFFNVSLWGRRGEAIVSYLTKGQQVVVVGDLSTREYEHNGEKHTSFEVRAADVCLVGGQRAEGGAPPPQGDSNAAQGDDDYIQF